MAATRVGRVDVLAESGAAGEKTVFPRVGRKVWLASSNSFLPSTGRSCREIKTINLKFDRPTVQLALERMERELASARAEKCAALKIIHGYGSTGTGGDIRVAVQKRLREPSDTGEIARCIFGEDWSQAEDATWGLLQASAGLKNDPDLGRRNLGITIVIL